MTGIPLQCGRMAAAASEYCLLIDDFGGFGRDQEWLPRMTKLLPRLHVAVIAMKEPGSFFPAYHFPDDDKRCELYMRLHSIMGEDIFFWPAGDDSQVKNKLCDRLADDLTDMYFDLKNGLDVIECDPQQAVTNWLCSFYLHWNRHLLDAEYWLHAVDADIQPLPV